MLSLFTTSFNSKVFAVPPEETLGAEGEKGGVRTLAGISEGDNEVLTSCPCIRIPRTQITVDRQILFRGKGLLRDRVDWLLPSMRRFSSYTPWSIS
jgi:hypothetical protein